MRRHHRSHALFHALTVNNPEGRASIGGIEDQLVAYGTASLDASWSLALTTSGKLTKLQLESIQFVEMIWE